MNGRGELEWTLNGRLEDGSQLEGRNDYFFVVRRRHLQLFKVRRERDDLSNGSLERERTDFEMSENDTFCIFSRHVYVSVKDDFSLAKPPFNNPQHVMQILQTHFKF